MNKFSQKVHVPYQITLLQTLHFFYNNIHNPQQSPHKHIQRNCIKILTSQT